ncbi:hypothetical protein N658DRAFT_494881 [Parathielavia hyrcaniae]|uniref:SH3 domain-containing protein n=1 Tax=Parathielavia hyrcaniae TaxID=113614 RepID=A0AAN6Q3H0_9PEZI|nr:hypothetical protein N658DRAFT_494881 [Parathielavia hyrcaniae]
MQSMQRQFGKLWNRGPGDNAKVAVILKDYEDADAVLAQLVENARMWRDAWAAIANSQLQVVTEFEALYDPIVGAADGQSAREAVPTPELQLQRTFNLKKAYTDLKTEVVDEIALIEGHVLKPAADARDCIAPIHKTIKKREDRRADYEKTQDKAEKLRRKPGRTPKEEAALAKADADFSRAADEFRIADEHLKATLPPIIRASFDLVPPLLSNLILVQNRLLGLYYTTVHGYCEEFGFPSPPPPMEDVVATWDGAFSPIRSHVESVCFLARGKALKPSKSNGNLSSSSSSSLMGGVRRTTSGLIPGPKPRMLRTPSTPVDDRTPAPSPSPSPAPSSYKRPDYSNATEFTAATILSGASVNRPSGTLSKQREYFNAAAAATVEPAAQQSAARAQFANGIGKKKPPPPPPKRAATTKPDEWVVAQYAFAGQGGSDLSFGEGARIRVVKKTKTDQDWWVGEFEGVTGNFPANYCKPVA